MDTPFGSIVIVSGPVGAGKTTVAREYVASAPGPTAYIEGDRFWSFIAKPNPKQLDSVRFTMIMRAMIAAARHYERDGFETIVDFSVPPWYLGAVRKLVQGRPFDYVVLRPSEATCAKRAAARSEGTIAEYGAYHDLYESFRGAERYTISDDASDAKAVASRIREGLRAGMFRVET